MSKDTPVKMPVCPYCDNEMTVQYYQGYYDEFPYWACNCKDSELKERATEVTRGQYA